MDAELDEWAEAATSSYSAAIDFWYYIYSVKIVRKSNQGVYFINFPV